MLALLVLVLLVAPVAAARTACEGVYFVRQPVHLLGLDWPEPAVVVASGQVSVGLCPPVPAETRRADGVTMLRARWDTCPGVDQPVVLRARIDRRCDRMIGIFRPEATLRGGRFKATRREGAPPPPPARCGTILGTECPEKQFCELPTNACGGADLEGRCVELPDACPAVGEPVCACNGKTYPNDCERQRDGLQKAHDGACECPPILCEPGTVPTDGDGDGCPDRCRPGCASNADCIAEDWCAGPFGSCHAFGACEPRPDACPLYLQPVCGCDGQTYGNGCEAASAGVRVAAAGSCAGP